jgi:hypothetical protein
MLSFDPDPYRFDDYAVTGFIGLNPVVTGGGTNLKLLNYLSRGMPVMTTPFGTRGHNDLDRAATVCQLTHFHERLGDPGAIVPPDRQRLEPYRWDTIATTMLTAIGDFCDACRSPLSGRATHASAADPRLHQLHLLVAEMPRTTMRTT